MNRIIIIGNGFDIANGIRTTYKEFIDDYWIDIGKHIINYKVGIDNDQITIPNHPYNLTKLNYPEIKNLVENVGGAIDFKNNFFKEITEDSSLHNWVDIENVYYSNLVDIAKKSQKDRDIKIKMLNETFEQVKSLLKAYLLKVQHKFLKDSSPEFKKSERRIKQNIYSAIKPKDLPVEFASQWAKIKAIELKKDIKGMDDGLVTFEELNGLDQKILAKIDSANVESDIKDILDSKNAHDYFDLIPKKTLFLNFNYTSTHNEYNSRQTTSRDEIKDWTLVKSIHIHGTIIDEDNEPMIFGFGDELDINYANIENLNNNDFLDNVKSIKYLESDQYRKLMEFANNDEFQIFIFGHSCGLSDRTLLNSLFEHSNCMSIKPFYHQWDGGDNYSDIVKNISRNFKDKVKMRELVVNKKYCEPLT
jgi:hypothetical protein